MNGDQGIIDDERQVLAGLFIDAPDVLRRCELENVTPSTFSVSLYRKIFQIAGELHAKGESVEQHTVRSVLTDAGELESPDDKRRFDEIGGLDSGDIQTTATIGHFIERTAAHERLRKMKALGQRVVELAALKGNPVDIAEDAERELAAFARSASLPRPALLEKLAARRLKASAPPLEPITRLFLAGKPIGTPGNLVAGIGKAKGGKTAFTGGIIAAPIAAAMGKPGIDALGFTASNPGGKALVVIDTEQSMFDAHTCLMRALRRAETNDDLPWLHAYGLAGWSAHELRGALRPALDLAVKANGGIFIVVLDGVADFVTDVNDAQESNAFVAELHGIAIEYDCTVVCIIHSNEAKLAGDDGRGHLGKQLTRKAESNLLLKKVGDITTVTSEKQRKAPITEADGVAFKWSDDEGRHVSCNAPGAARDVQKAGELRDLANEVFGTDRVLRWTELKDRIATARDLKGNTPGRRVDAMKTLGVIRLTSFGQYERVA